MLQIHLAHEPSGAQLHRCSLLVMKSHEVSLATVSKKVKTLISPLKKKHVNTVQELVDILYPLCRFIVSLQSLYALSYAMR